MNSVSATKLIWRRAALSAAAVMLFSMSGARVALAYVGASFVQIPDVAGGWKGKEYRNWLKVDAHYWKQNGMQSLQRSAAGFGRKPNFFSGPAAPAKGAGALVIAIDKSNSILPQLMERCLKHTSLGELTYAESSDRSRGPFEIGPHPKGIPSYYEYRLKDAVFDDCPVVADAPQQALVISFKEIEWSNYNGGEAAIPVTLETSALQPAPASDKTRSFVLTWFAYANDVSDDQCPVMASKPTEEDYYRYVSNEDATKERAELKDKGVSYENGQMSMRGPHRLSVGMLPGIIPDPGNPEPQTKVAHGLNLDGTDGAGKPAAGTCKHQKFVSEDGTTGIDNQLYRALGCISSFQGHKGFIMQFANNQMHDGLLSMLVQITGIENERNSKSVDVTLFYSLDPMIKNANGSQVGPDYTFRVTDNPLFSHYFARLHGRIKNGVVITDPVKELDFNLGQYGTPQELKLRNARIRIELRPDRTIKGVVGGYVDWQAISTRYNTSVVEMYHGFQTPGLYNSLRRNADGGKNPVTGQCEEISTAYQMEGLPAFIAPSESTVAAQGSDHRNQISRAGDLPQR
jgi:hypothetical protein